MITFERFEELTYELTAQLPEEFFHRLDGGVMAREGVVIHPAALEDDLVVLGEYRRRPYLGRFVVLYYGSFMRVYGSLSEERLKAEMWRVLRHEFLHHLESLAGEHSLEIEDAVRIAAYRSAHEKKTENEPGSSREGV